jgi:hypothetical protein
MLLPEDLAYLRRAGSQWEVTPENGFTCVVIHSFRLPPGYSVSETDLLLRLPPGFPDAVPDMWWCLPEVRLASGAYPPNTEAQETHLGRTWQRWSRHFSPGQWSAGRSGVETYLATIRTDLLKWVR